MLHRRRLLTAAALVGAVLLLAPAASRADRPPTASEAAAIRYAFGHGVVLCCVPNEKYRVVDIRVSTIDRSFATARIQPLSKDEQGADAVLWRGTKRWAVIDLGTDFLGCNFLTAAVRKDLFGSTLCP